MASSSRDSLCFCSGVAGAVGLTAASSICSRLMFCWDGVGATGAALGAGAGGGAVAGGTPWRTLFWSRSSLARCLMIVSGPAHAQAAAKPRVAPAKAIFFITTIMHTAPQFLACQ